MTSPQENNNRTRVFRHQEWEPNAKGFEFMEEPTKTSNGGLAIGFRYEGAKLRVKTPKLRLPFGLQTGMNGSGFNIQLTFNDSEVGQNFLKQCQRFDKIIEQAGIEHADTWFAKKNGKSPTAAVIKDKFYPMVKPASDERYQPTFRIKLPSKKVLVSDPDNPEAKDGKIEVDAFQCRLFDKDKRPRSIDDSILSGGCHVTVLMSCSSIWSTSTGFGATWKAEQIMVFPSMSSQLPDHCLLDDESSSDEEADEEIQVSSQESADKEAETQVPPEEQAEVQEEPEDENLEASEEEEPVPKKPVARAKKTVAKK